VIYVDEVRHWGKRGEWCHMMTDGDIDELHRMAARIGLQRSWFQEKNARHPHYDLRPSKRALAIKAGAVEVSSAELLQRCTRQTQDAARGLPKQLSDHKRHDDLPLFASVEAMG
jgi:hypothetical protein